MKDLIKNLAGLVKVKTLVTVTVLGVFAALALQGRIDGKDVMVTTSMVISFYFGTQHEKKSKG